jgi:hypothetical protein
MKKKQAVPTIPDNFLECRDYGHNWKPYNAEVDNRRRFVKRIQQCGNCESFRSHKISTAVRSRGQLIPGSASYSHAEGYLNKGHGRLTADAKDQIRWYNTELLLEKILHRQEELAPAAA